MSTKTIRSEEYPDKEIQTLRKGDTLVWISLKNKTVEFVYVYRHVQFDDESIPCSHLPIFTRPRHGRHH